MSACILHLAIDQFKREVKDSHWSDSYLYRQKNMKILKM